jgi:hypothetical protein
MSVGYYESVSTLQWQKIAFPPTRRLVKSTPSCLEFLLQVVVVAVIGVVLLELYYR